MSRVIRMSQWRTDNEAGNIRKTETAEPVDWGDEEYFIAGPQERLFGDWTPGRDAWEPVDVEPLPEPIPARGGTGCGMMDTVTGKRHEVLCDKREG
jgi:hypothetical protein